MKVTIKMEINGTPHKWTDKDTSSVTAMKKAYRAFSVKPSDEVKNIQVEIEN